MPVMDGYVFADSPHEKTVVKDGAVYGCHNKPRDTLFGQFQAGWTDDGRRQMVCRPIPPIGPCKHDSNMTDSMCSGCKWVG